MTLPDKYFGDTLAETSVKFPGISAAFNFTASKTLKTSAIPPAI